VRKLALVISIISLSLLSHLTHAEKKDMPAADMVKWLDINDLNKFDNPKYENLIRRWWNIKEL